LTANPHILSSGKVKDLAKKYKRTPEQILYAVLIGEGIIPLIGTTSEQHMKEDLEIVGLEVSPEERKAVFDLCI
jgi:diketogulonate reductase-like aldo/keto reductase